MKNRISNVLGLAVIASAFATIGCQPRTTPERTEGTPEETYQERTQEMDSPQQLDQGVTPSPERIEDTP